MNKIKVLLAEDELSLAFIIKESLEERDFEVLICSNGKVAMQEYELQKPDILVLDIMMPEMDGFVLARHIRKKDSQTPIIFLTSRAQPKDVVAGFEAGANDYLKKPFSMEELIIRIRVLLSTQRILTPAMQEPKDIFTIGSFTFYAHKNLLKQGIANINLTSRESEILKLMCLNQQEILKRDIVLEKVWGKKSFFNARSLDVFIVKIRKHLAQDSSVQIITVKGVGYKLVF